MQSDSCLVLHLGVQAWELGGGSSVASVVCSQPRQLRGWVSGSGWVGSAAGVLENNRIVFPDSVSMQPRGDAAPDAAGVGHTCLKRR